MNLSFPLLLARKREKNMEKLLVRRIISFVISLVILLVFCAWRVRSLKELTLLNDINNNLYICKNNMPFLMISCSISKEDGCFYEGKLASDGFEVIGIIILNRVND